MNTGIGESKFPLAWFYPIADDLITDVYQRSVYMRIVRRSGGTGTAWESQSNMAKACGMSRQKMNDTLHQLVLAGFIKCETRDGDTNVYTLVDLSSTTTGGVVHNDRGCRPQRHKEGKEEVNEETPIVPKGTDADWEEFCSHYPKRDGDLNRSKAKAKFLSLKKNGENPKGMIEGVARYRRWCDAKGKTGTEFVKQMLPWLNQRCWEEPWELPTAGGAVQWGQLL